jgi:hypothetical protein
MPVARIISADRKSITLALIKPLLLHTRYSQDYNQVNCLNLAILSKLAYYKEKEAIKQFLFGTGGGEGHGRGTGFGCPNVSVAFLSETSSVFPDITKTFVFINDESTDTQLFLYRVEKTVIISFRGTASPKDGLTDSKSTLEPFSDGVGRVHKGFLSAFQAIKKQLDEEIKRLETITVILTGHSLGAAIATVAGAYIRHVYKCQVMLYTYGSPRVGDATFVHHFTKVEPVVHFRCIHNTDLVPMIPPPYTNLRLHLIKGPITFLSAFIDPFGKPFTHHGKPVWLRRLPGNLCSVDPDKKAPAWHKIEKAQDVVISRPKWDEFLGGSVFSVNDHFMENYISILGSHLRCSLLAYLDNTGEEPRTHCKALIKYLESELTTLKVERDRLLLTMPGLADATDVTGTASAQEVSPRERFDLLNAIISDKSFELSLEKSKLTRMESPAFAAGLLSQIIGEKMTPALRREMEYQAAHIKY